MLHLALTKSVAQFPEIQGVGSMKAAYERSRFVVPGA
jgi:hypothetical protein